MNRKLLIMAVFCFALIEKNFKLVSGFGCGCFGLDAPVVLQTIRRSYDRLVRILRSVRYTVFFNCQRGFRRCVFFFPCFDLLAVEMKLVLNDSKHPLRANSAMALSHFLERKFHCAELNVSPLTIIYFTRV